MNTTDPVLEAVREVVADVAAREVSEVRPTDGFFTDLDGESIDALELTFLCEKRFGVKLALSEVIPEEGLTTDDRGALTTESLAWLKRELPFLDYRRIEGNPLKNRLRELFTVDAIAHFVKRALASKAMA